jgi:hypothetical protein
LSFKVQRVIEVWWAVRIPRPGRFTGLLLWVKHWCEKPPGETDGRMAQEPGMSRGAVGMLPTPRRNKEMDKPCLSDSLSLAEIQCLDLYSPSLDLGFSSCLPRI